MASAAPSGYSFTCMSYNLKRKVAELAPVTAEEFAQRVLSRQAADRSQAEDAQLGFTCNLCNKTYANENGYRNHIASKKHKERAAAADIDTEQYPTALLTRQPKKGGKAVPEVSPATVESPNELEQEQADVEAMIEKKLAEAVKLELNDCLFCPLKLPTMEDALDHMATHHSFFIPDIDYLVDLPGLLTYLGEKVSVGNACLWCYSPYRTGHTEKTAKGLFKSLTDVRKHMCDKGHCKILYEDGADIEIADYYDFSSTWEGVDDVGADGDADASVAAGAMTVDAESSQLILPSGKALGHRELRVYYKQNVRKPSAADAQAIVHVSDRYKSLGAYAEEVQKMELRVTKDLERRKQYYQMGLGMRHNKLQKHFREQVLY
ncbi:C2H2 type zinc-finger-domain-containing protein [Catenaria anguillulae PL171]|uniref:C2H2 type zinc-finger-domain-containing protein n=1 Tax=Catenaria anguillulae PL171 TaxID=765915 RepID=A0A1Y2I2S3_9FUNG|nr:C2H2 type zinc-finger-domain-containing protein [Catenaria anguillulae PL171]